MIDYRYFFLLAAFGTLAVSCKDPYMPDLKKSNTNVLVVEGYIDGADSTIVNLSKVRMISKYDTANKQWIDDANVFVESENGITYPLINLGQGRYGGLYFFDPSMKYSLSIITNGNKRYKSEFVTMKQSPPIDSVNLRIDGNGASIMVNTHDNSKTTTYYRWRWDDTWEFHSTFESEVFYDAVREKVFPRYEGVYVCWQSDHSKEILINSSAKLQKDEVRNFPINRIPFGDYRLSVLYSINVKQYAMDSLGYNFYALLKKNSEDVGTLFDPQPNNIRGNIHSLTDSSEIVVGYIGAGLSTAKRTFFRVSWDHRQSCPEPYTVPKDKDSLIYYFVNGGYIPMYPEVEGLDTTGWVSGVDFCVDCTLRGTNKKPIFWP